MIATPLDYEDMRLLTHAAALRRELDLLGVPRAHPARVIIVSRQVVEKWCARGADVGSIHGLLVVAV